MAGKLAGASANLQANQPQGEEEGGKGKNQQKH
jgi:hypothetical protein